MEPRASVQLLAAAEGTAVPETASLAIGRVFTDGETHPYDEIEWMRRDALIGSEEKKIFEQRGVEFPASWSQNAVNITASKYFRGKLGSPEREWSVKQMIDRVVKTIRGWGEASGYFSAALEAAIFEDELTHLLVNQKGAFNSPVWFNVGVRDKPQCSACFILSVKDEMNSILNWIHTEGIIFKGGSGAGIDLSPLRSKHESLSGGGRASGPVSFMRGADSVAGMIKSGGTTRRAAKMVILQADHPDIRDFVWCKANEEDKIRAFMDAGFDMSDINAEAWNSIQYQNANNSVRLDDEFMARVERDETWETRFRTTGEVAERMSARDLLMEIAEAAWKCGDPGVQFDTTINSWNTCPRSGRITATNPCAEYVHLDDTSCNLASLNLMKFMNDDGTFAVSEFKQAVRVFILAQEILVDNAGYPTPLIEKNSRAFRELGLGYANLGSLLMTRGIPYDSDRARAFAGAITSLLTGEAYRFSAELARARGPFAEFTENREQMLGVIRRHQSRARELDERSIADPELAREAAVVWDEAVAGGEAHGYRNSQISLIAPTGTIAFLMDCRTTGIEPTFSHVALKQLVGGGWMKIVNDDVSASLRALGYREQDIADIVTHLANRGTIEGALHLKSEHLPVFDCAVQPKNGARSISWQGHVKMVAAVQPFVSGAISKTFNMPNETTPQEIFDSYLMAWRLGIKAFAVYRDGSKVNQPLQTAAKKEDRAEEASLTAVEASPQAKETEQGGAATRRRLPTTRPSETHKFSVAGHEGYLTYSKFDDGSLAEMFILIAKQGSTLRGLLDAFAISVSVALQYGVPFKDLAQKFIWSRFEPAGLTKNPDVRVATSIIDYIFRYLALQLLSPDDLSELGLNGNGHVQASGVDGNGVEIRLDVPTVGVASREADEGKRVPSVREELTYSDTVCTQCGGMMVRSGSCLTCKQCGTSSGGCS